MAPKTANHGLTRNKAIRFKQQADFQAVVGTGLGVRLYRGDAIRQGQEFAPATRAAPRITFHQHLTELASRGQNKPSHSPRTRPVSVTTSACWENWQQRRKGYAESLLAALKAVLFTDACFARAMRAIRDALTALGFTAFYLSSCMSALTFDS
jgi:hypothetical protein